MAMGTAIARRSDTNLKRVRGNKVDHHVVKECKDLNLLSVTSQPLRAMYE